MHVIFDRLCHFSSANIKLIAGLHFGGQLTQHKEAAEAMAMTGLRADRNLAAAAELMIMDVVHTFVVSKNNDKHVACTRMVHSPGGKKRQVAAGTCRAPPSHRQMLPGRTVAFSNSNDEFRQYRTTLTKQVLSWQLQPAGNPQRAQTHRFRLQN